jgi:hypothetical protein
MFSGCLDEQTSADTSVAGEACGALSYSFVSTIVARDGKLSYIELLNEMRNVVKKMSRTITQIPQLSSTQEFDLTSQVQL